MGFTSPSWRYARPLSVIEQKEVESHIEFATKVAIARIGRFSSLLDEAVGESYLALCFAVLDHGSKDQFLHHLRTKIRGAVGKVIRNNRPCGYRRNRFTRIEDRPKLFGSESYEFRYYPGSYWDREIDE